MKAKVFFSDFSRLCAGWWVLPAAVLIPPSRPKRPQRLPGKETSSLGNKYIIKTHKQIHKQIHPMTHKNII